MKAQRFVMLFAILSLLAGLAYSTAAWAAPGQTPERQTVPTKTPPAPPKQGQDTPTPTSTATRAAAAGVTPASAVPAATAGVTTTLAAPQTLPQSGSPSWTLPWGLVAAGLLLVGAGWLAWRQATR